MKCDAKEFAGMYGQVCRDLYRYALCVLKNPHDAEDAVSEAVLNAYEHISSLRSRDSFRSWIFTILANTCRRKLKRAGREQSVEDIGEVFAAQEARRYEGQQCDLSIDLKHALAELSREEQMIVGLSVFGGYRSREIAQMLRMKDGTVRSKRSRALMKMNLALNDTSGIAGKGN